MTNEERIYELIESAYSLAVTATNRITELKQENSELKKRVAELENASKPKRKFRAMTNMEYCIKYACEENFSCLNCSLYRYSSICVLADESIIEKPFKTKDGKYILREVKE